MLKLPRGFTGTYIKNKIRVQSKARSGEKAESRHRRDEYFEPFRNTAMGT
jgi:hypothetical protein